MGSRNMWNNREYLLKNRRKYRTRLAGFFHNWESCHDLWRSCTNIRRPDGYLNLLHLQAYFNPPNKSQKLKWFPSKKIILIFLLLMVCLVKMHDFISFIKGLNILRMGLLINPTFSSLPVIQRLILKHEWQNPIRHGTNKEAMELSPNRYKNSKQIPRLIWMSFFSNWDYWEMNVNQKKAIQQKVWCHLKLHWKMIIDL